MTAWGTRLALAGSILLAWPGFASPVLAPKLLALAAGLALAWAFVPAARKAPLAAPLLAVLAAAALSAAFSLDRFQSFWGDGRQPFYGVLQLVLYALAYLLAASSDDKQLEAGFSALRWSAAGCVVLAALQAAGVLSPGWSSVNGRLLGPSGNPAFFGAIAALLWPLCLGRKDGVARLGAWGLPVALALTYTRGAWLAAAAGGAVWLVVSRRAKPRAWWGAAAAAALLGVLLAGRLLGRGHSDVVRRELWSAGARAAALRPATGWGADTYLLALRRLKTREYVTAVGSATIEQSSAHNDVLQAAATMGVPGLLAYLWLLGAAFLALKRAASGGEARAAEIAGALAAAFVVTKFNPVTPETCATAAWLVGAAGARGAALPRWGKAVPAAASVAALALVVFMVRSESEAFASRAALARGRVPEAVRRAADADRLAPGRLGAEVALAEALVAQGDGARALEAGRRAARRHPGNPQAHELAGSAALFAGVTSGDAELLREAIAELDEAVRQDPFHPYAPGRRAQAEQALERLTTPKKKR